MRRGVTAAVSAACGVACAACVLAYTASVDSQAEQARAEALERYGGEQVEVCVATNDLAPGETITESDVELVMWIADLLPEEPLYSLEDAVGMQVSSSILAGEVVSARRLGEVGADLDVPDGMVAVSVPAEDVQTVGGAVSAGSRVDMYATGSTTTALIAQDVLVLATSAGSEDDEVTWVTVAVEPEAAQEVVTAAQETELYFTLPGDVVEEASAQEEADEEEEAGDGL